jgi:hypothetical protein
MGLHETTVAEPHTPTEHELTHGTRPDPIYPGDRRMLTTEERRRGIARIKAEAARAALQGLADQEAGNAERRRFKDDQRGYALCRHAKHAADDYRHTHFPEETR